MRSRKNHSNITAAEVYSQTAALVRNSIGIQDQGYRCTAKVILGVLFFAASRITSIFAACRNLDYAPTDQAIGYALLKTLPELHQLQRRINDALVAGLPRGLRRRPQCMAIDLTLIPYHGEPFREEREIYRSQPKSGTSHFHAYATCYVVRHGHRFTLAMMPVPQGTSMEDVVRQLLRQARLAGVKCRLLLLDRGFYSVAVMRYLQCARVPFLMPAVIRGTAATKNRPAGGTRFFAGWKTSGQSEYTVRTTRKTPYGKSVRVKICVACSNYAGQWRRRGRRTFVYAYWGFAPSSPHWVRETYRLRFGIETSYRQANQARIRTCTRNPLLRLFYFGFALILRNVWVWFHLLRFGIRHGGGVRLRLEDLRFQDLLLYIQRVVEIQLGIPPDQKTDVLLCQTLMEN